MALGVVCFLLVLAGLAARGEQDVAAEFEEEEEDQEEGKLLDPRGGPNLWSLRC
jgi:hypothetical protein